MNPLRSIPARQVLSKCPWRDRQVHTVRKPELLTEVEVQDITLQISENGYRALPYRGIAKQCYRCRDCHAVWVASSIFERVAEDAVCGVYDEIPIWTPYPLMEKVK
jgi:hypothetical protein